MTKFTTGQENDLEFSLDEEAAPDESEFVDDGSDQGDEDDPDRDPNALPVTLKTTTFNGEDCVEFYARGEIRKAQPTGPLTSPALAAARRAADR